MRRVTSGDTKPEMKVRRLIYSLGYRYRLHRKDLPGKPDVVFIGKKKAIFVHGCFWHGHSCKRGARTPKTNRKYWTEKISKNIERDKRNIQKLKEMDWEILIIWECQTRDMEALSEIIEIFLK